MTTDEPDGLLRPVSASSVLVHHPRVRYTELAGVGIVCRTDTKSISSLSPAAATTWARFDGRTPLSAIGTGPELLELTRRLRAVGALIDATPGQDAPHDLQRADRPQVDVVLHGSWAPTADGRQAVVDLGGTAGTADTDPPTIVVEVGPDRISVASTPVARLEAPGSDLGDEPLGAISALELLVTFVDPDELARPGCLDALAELVERVPVVARPASTTAGGGPASDQVD